MCNNCAILAGSGVARGGGGWGVQTPSIEKGVHFCCLVIEQKQWLIIKIVATRCRILRLKCTKFRFRLGLRPRPRWGSHSAPPDPQAGFKRSYFQGKGRERKGKEERDKGERGEGIGARTQRPSPVTNFWLCHCLHDLFQVLLHVLFYL